MIENAIRDEDRRTAQQSVIASEAAAADLEIDDILELALRDILLELSACDIIVDGSMDDLH